jgi:hypothetical protein
MTASHLDTCCTVTVELLAVEYLLGTSREDLYAFLNLEVTGWKSPGSNSGNTPELGYNVMCTFPNLFNKTACYILRHNY